MELRLQKFINSLASLSDIRNLDPANPVFINLEHPVTRNPVVTLAAAHDPTYLGIPINSVWVVLDPHSLYYGQALRFRAWSLPTTYMDHQALGFPNAWSVVQRYTEIFDHAQYFENIDSSTLKGPTGDQGEPGPKGPPGADGADGLLPVIDYDGLVARVLQQSSGI